jgi:hypothetical protein
MLPRVWSRVYSVRILGDEDSPIVTVAVLYALAYLNEHREEADHNA